MKHYSSDVPRTLLGALVLTLAIVVVATGASAARAQSTSHAPATSTYPISKDKQALVVRVSENICGQAIRGDFFHYKMFLQNAGLRYLGEAITVEEAYPYIRCDGPPIEGVDLLRINFENPDSGQHFTDLILYFEEEAIDKTFLRKVVNCKRFYDGRCMDVFAHIERNRRIHSDSPTFTKKYDYLEIFLRKRINALGGPLRDRQFCREVLGEPSHCQ